MVLSPKTSRPPPLQAQSATPPALSKLDFVAPIFAREQKFRCAWPESARAATNVQGHRPALPRIDSGPLDRFPDTGRRLFPCRGQAMAPVNASAVQASQQPDE